MTKVREQILGEITQRRENPKKLGFILIIAGLFVTIEGLLKGGSYLTFVGIGVVCMGITLMFYGRSAVKALFK